MTVRLRDGKIVGNLTREDFELRVDGRRHDLAVRVNRPGTIVQARTSYVAR